MLKEKGADGRMASQWKALRNPGDKTVDVCMEHRIHTRKEYTDVAGKEVSAD